MVDAPLELTPANAADIVAALRAHPAPLRTRIPNPRAVLARRLWDETVASADADRDAYAEAFAERLRARPAPTATVDPLVGEAVARAATLIADSWLRVRVTEDVAGRRAGRVRIDASSAVNLRQDPASTRFIAVAIAPDERAEDAYCRVALGDLHIPVRYVAPEGDCSGALAIVDAAWDGPQRAAALTRFGRPLLVAATSGAHETLAPAAVYDPLVPDGLAEAIRAVLRLG
jgi:hypothetical protein